MHYPTPAGIGEGESNPMFLENVSRAYRTIATECFGNQLLNNLTSSMSQHGAPRPVCGRAILLLHVCLWERSSNHD